MPLTIRRTGASEYGKYLKLLICGDPGAGKTRSASTYPKPLIASIGANLMSVADREVPFAEITSSQDLLHLRHTLDNTPEDRALLLGVEVETVIIDTFDHYQQVLIAERKRDEHKDTFAPADFGWLNDELRAVLRGFRNLPMHVVFHLHLKVSEDMQTNQMYFRPSLQGALGDEVSAYVDVALAFKSGNTTVIGADGNPQRVITRYAQTYRDAQHPWIRDNSGQLPPELEINFEDDFQRIYDGVFGGLALPASSTVHEVNEGAVVAARQARLEASLAVAAPPAAPPVADAAPPAPAQAPAAPAKKAAAKKAAPPAAPKRQVADAEAVAAGKPKEDVASTPEPVADVVEEIVEEVATAAVEADLVGEDPEEAAAAALEAELTAELESALTGDTEPAANGHKPEAVIPTEVAANELPPCADCGGVIETEDQADLSQIRFRRKLCRDCHVSAKRSLRSA